MEIIAKISRGSKMDQIYIPKHRPILDIGEYVIIKPLKSENIKDVNNKKLFFYRIEKLEPIKLTIINDVLKIIDKYIKYENIIITGSIFDKGFNFNDVDILLISENKPNIQIIVNDIEKKLGIIVHLLVLDNKSFNIGLETDPLYQSMISRCITVKRPTPIKENKINYKLLDLHLLKSNVLIDGIDILSGKEKYDLVRNLIAIHLFLKGTKVTVDKINKEIVSLFKNKVEEIKENRLDKITFLKKYRQIYDKTANKILDGIKNESKQK